MTPGIQANIHVLSEGLGFETMVKQKMSCENWSLTLENPIHPAWWL